MRTLSAADRNAQGARPGKLSAAERSALNQALAKALAFRDAGKMPEAREWAAELVRLHTRVRYFKLDALNNRPRRRPVPISQNPVRAGIFLFCRRQHFAATWTGFRNKPIMRPQHLGLAASTAFHEHLRQRRRQRNMDVPYHNLISRFINRAATTNT
jgi:hypothetical protein